MTTRKPKTNPEPLPDPTERAKSCAAEAAERNAKRPMRPQVSVEMTAAKACRIGPSHRDHRGWQETMLDAFGTTSFDFISSAIDGVSNALRNTDGGGFEQHELNAALAAIAGAKPENEIEAMLVAQMATTHALAMRALGHARRAELLPQYDAHGSLAVKLLRTFTMQAEALSKLKRGGEQTVRVEHVHVHSGGQAIVGTVSTQQAGGGGHDERGRQPDGPIDARALAFAPSAGMFGEDEGRDAVPASCREGQETVQAPRRRGRERSAVR